MKKIEMPTLEELQEMAAVDIRTVDRSTLVELDDVEIHEELPQAERIADYIKQIKNLIACRHSVHCNMEKTAELTHRNKEICRKKYYEKATRHINIATRKLCYGKNHSDSRSAVCNQVHNRNGIKLHCQHFHRYFSEFFGFNIHFIIFEFV